MEQVILVSDDSDPDDIVITNVKLRRKSVNKTFIKNETEPTVINATDSDDDIVFVSSIKTSKTVVIQPENSGQNGNDEQGRSLGLRSIPSSQFENNKSQNDLSLPDDLSVLPSANLWNDTNICQAAGSINTDLDRQSLFDDIPALEKTQSPNSTNYNFDTGNQSSTVDTSDLSLICPVRKPQPGSFRESGSTSAIQTASIFEDYSYSKQVDSSQICAKKTTQENRRLLSSLLINNPQNAGAAVVQQGGKDRNSPLNTDDIAISAGGTSTDKSPINMPDIFRVKHRKVPKTFMDDSSSDEDDLPLLSFGALGKSDQEQDTHKKDKGDKVWEVLEGSSGQSIDDKTQDPTRKKDKGKRLKMKFRSYSETQTSSDILDQSDDEQMTLSFGRTLKNAGDIKVDEGASTSGVQRSSSQIDFISSSRSNSPVAMVKPLLIRRLSSGSLSSEKAKRKHDYLYKLERLSRHKRQKKMKKEKMLFHKLEKRKSWRRLSEPDNKLFAVKDFDLVMSQLKTTSAMLPGIGVSSASLGGHNQRHSGFVCNPPNCNPPNGTAASLQANLTSNPLKIKIHNAASVLSNAPASAPAATGSTGESLESWLSAVVTSSSSNHNVGSTGLSFVNTKSSVSLSATATPTSSDIPLLPKSLGTYTATQVKSTTTQSSTQWKEGEGTFRKLKLKLDLISKPLAPKKPKLSNDVDLTVDFPRSFFSEDVCYYCGMTKPKAELSSCTKSHMCCGKCLEDHTKSLLLGKNHKPSSSLSAEKTSEGDVLKCQKLLTTLINVCKEHNQKNQVIQATQKLIDATIEIDSYVNTLRRLRIEGTLSSYSTVAYYLKKSLPLLRCKLLYGSLQLDNIRVPPMKVVDLNLVSQMDEGSQEADPRSTWSLQCRYPKCNSYFPMSELRKTLPSMVVDMLEEKLDRSFLDFMSDELMNQVDGGNQGTGSDTEMAQAVASIVPDSGDAELNQTDEGKSQQPRPDSDLPDNWTRMEEGTEFEVVPLNEDSEEYFVKAAMFHDTMFFPKNEILSIKRVQNPMLWKFYQLRKAKMGRDNPSTDEIEKELFHGTRKEVVEAICRDNFDFRLSGIHGHAYGQGTYFARDASYSHGYCLDWNTTYMGKLNLPGRIQHRRLITRLKQMRHTATAAGIPGQPINMANLPLGVLGTPAASSLSMLQGQVPIVQNPHQQLSSQTPYSSTAAAGGAKPPPAYALLQRLQSTLSGPNSLAGINAQMFRKGQLLVPQHQVQQSGLHNLSSAQPGSGVTSVQQSNAVSSTTPVSATHNTLQQTGQTFGGNPLDLSFPKQQTDQYTYHTMFIAKVLVGQMTRGSAGMKRPPPIDPKNEFGKLYDSCVDSLQYPGIFVVFEPQQSYPEYILEYRNRRDDTL